MLVEMPARTIWVTPRRRSWRSSSVPVNAPPCRLTRMMSPGCGGKSSGNSEYAAGGADSGPGTRARPGGRSPPSAENATLTRTTGSAVARNAAASRRPRFLISSWPMRVGRARMPFCKSIRTSADRWSMVIAGMAYSFDCFRLRGVSGACGVLAEGGAHRRDQQIGQRADVLECLDAEHGLLDGALAIRIDHRAGQVAVLG